MNDGLRFANPSYESIRRTAVGRWIQPVRGKRWKRLWRFHHTKVIRRTDPPQEIGVAASNSRTPRTKARRLVCNGGYSRFAVNDGLRFANPSYELFRLTALRIDPPYRVYELIRLTALPRLPAVAGSKVSFQIAGDGRRCCVFCTASPRDVGGRRSICSARIRQCSRSCVGSSVWAENKSATILNGLIKRNGDLAGFIVNINFFYVCCCSWGRPSCVIRLCVSSVLSYSSFRASSER